MKQKLENWSLQAKPGDVTGLDKSDSKIRTIEPDYPGSYKK